MTHPKSISRPAAEAAVIALGDSALTIEQFHSIVSGKARVAVSAAATERNAQAFAFLLEKSKHEIIYGVNTGLGPMAQYKVPDTEVRQLQLNLIRSHSTGTGEMLSEEQTKALMVARLNSIVQGYSALHPSVFELLCEFINRGIYPVVYKHGGVGASGDLVQLAHVALALCGEGDVRHQGKLMPAADVLERNKLKPISIECREGLGLINGTSCMTGVGLLNVRHAERLLALAITASSLINELCAAFNDHISKEINSVKRHPGQQYVAGEMRRLLEGSSRVGPRKTEELLTGTDGEKFEKRVQEYYSIRCIPQILGPIHDTITYARQVLENELNSVSDNPITSIEHETVFHGGNFHGDYVSLEMDKLKIAITKLSMLAERQLNFLLHHRLNKVLPPFINAGKLGLNLGMQGIQYTATSTVAENQTFSNPMYVHSIPSNNDNQDIVSMGTNAAVITARVLSNTYEVLAVHIICIAQAIHYLKIENELSPALKQFFAQISDVVPLVLEDRPLSKMIEEVKTFLKQY